MLMHTRTYRARRSYATPRPSTSPLRTRIAHGARERVLGGGSGTAMLGVHAVTLSVHPAPAPLPSATSADSASNKGKGRWTDEELLAGAVAEVERELRVLLEKDVMDRVVGAQLRRMAAEWRAKPREEVVRATGEREGKRDLKSMSFKRAVRKEKPAPTPIVKEVEVEKEEEKEEVKEDEEMGEEQVVVERPKKKRKKAPPVPVKVVDVESEDEEEGQVWAGQKRPAAEQEDEEVPQQPRKKAKVETKSKSKKKAQKKSAPVEQVVLPEYDEAPAVADGICEDDEDAYYAKLVLSGTPLPPSLDPPAPPDAASVPFFRRHITGSARTEGFYKITHAEKVAYVTQYQARANASSTLETPAQSTEEAAPQQHVESRAQGLEEINQVQRAVALSKGETAAANELSFKFNQLQTRKKHLRFARSPIHDWGLYAMERIARGEMVIEYVGEVIRAQVAEKREKIYERQGIGSSYLFRIDEDLVVDATKKGNLGRLINHSCDPNCTAKIITINGEKKIVIYAKQEIELGDEITYDYHFPFEQDKIPCLCGSAKCRGFLN
ncbi:hypothetical protein MSAN_00922500 [Mycena sanguinolenta]|uniref:Histone-lysine N-methyltransferase, H3 lysine-4 specific n=1 Tax=Mycena sanguinolenta TaxID=230812 RepID=A0A8H6YXK1_9AGAR|nr:hypothetical protein MSAN_00922500 [Mycena sanguinolenta]